MNRFFRSALFPLIVIVLLVYLASQTLIPDQKAAKKVTYSDLIQRVQKDPDSIALVDFNPKKQQITATPSNEDDPKVKVNYPTPQSQIEFQNLLQRRRRRVRLEGHRLVGVVGPPRHVPAARAADPLLALHHEPDAGRRLEGDELREEPREADVPRLAEGDVQGRRRL